MPILQKLKKRVIDITYKHGLSHLSSTLSTLPILFEIYNEKDEDEAVILSNGHAGLALYVILEHFYGIDAEALLSDYGIHPSRDLDRKIFCTTGSLGQGICIAVGHALADRSKNVYVVISDGECSEGRVWEALRFSSDYNLSNLKIYLIANGLGAYDTIDSSVLYERSMTFNDSIQYRLSEPLDLNGKTGLDTHYMRLTKKEYDTLIEEQGGVDA